MALETDLRNELAVLVADQFFPDETPNSGYDLPCIVWTSIGGKVGWYVEQERPDHSNTRVRIAVWAKSRDEASQLMDQVEEKLCKSTILVVEPIGGRVSDSDSVLGARAYLQDFGIWYQR